MLLKQMSDTTFAFWCPGCDDLHVVDETWSFNGDQNRPTFHPSVYVWGENSVCHFFVNAGKLLFLPDCTHELVEQTVPMRPLPDWMTGEPEKVRKTRRDPELTAEDGFYYPELDDIDIVDSANDPDEPRTDLEDTDLDFEDDDLDDFYPILPEKGLLETNFDD